MTLFVPSARGRSWHSPPPAAADQEASAAAPFQDVHARPSCVHRAVAHKTPTSCAAAHPTAGYEGSADASDGSRHRASSDASVGWLKGDHSEQADSPITDWQMEAWVLDTRPERHEVAAHTVADNWMTLEGTIKALRATFPEPHFIIVTPTVER